MKNILKLKKKIVINTVFIEKSNFNEPIYIINSNKDSISVYSNAKRNNVTIKKIKIDEEHNTKTYITIKEFFKRCTKDDTEYKIEKVDNGDIYIRVAYYGDLSLFFKIGKTKNFILTNINKYKFIKTNNNTYQALSKINLPYFDKEHICAYIKNLKNIKRDYIYSLNKSLERLEKDYKKSLITKQN